MKPKDLLTKEFLNHQCITLAKSGFEIAKEFNLNTMTVYNYIKKFGISKPRDKFQDLDLEEDFNQGLSVKQIASKYDISYSAAYKRTRHLIKKSTESLTYKNMYEDKVVQKMTIKDIAIKYNSSEPTVSKFLDKYDIKHSRRDIRDVLTKEKFYEMYYVQDMSLREIAKEFDTVYQGTILDLMKEWGFDSRSDMRTVKQLLANQKSRRHNEISGEVLTKLIGGSKTRGRIIEVYITLDDIWTKMIEQDKKCALTGLDVFFPKTSKEYKTFTATASVDRIDPNLDYTMDNIQIVHKYINIMKNKLSQEEFIRFCKLVTNHKGI